MMRVQRLRNLIPDFSRRGPSDPNTVSWRHSFAKRWSQLDWIVQPLLAFGLSRLLIFVIGIVGDIYLPTEAGHWVADPESPFLSLWAKWDSQWYIQIAREGYWYRPVLQSNVAFFPLYPMLVHLVAPLTGGNLILAGFWVSNVTFALALIVLYQFTALILADTTSLDVQASRAASRRTVFYLAFFPTAFFFSAVYTESLFLLLSIAAALFARRQQWLLAAAAGMLAAMTRNVGVLLWGVVVWEWLRCHGWRLATIHRRDAWRSLWSGLRTDGYQLLLISAIPLGLFLYMGFLQSSFGRPFAFIEVQSAWGRENIGPVAVLIREVRALTEFTMTKGNLNRVMSLGTFLGALALLPAVWRRVGEGYALYVLILLLLPSASGLQSMIRYLLPLFPLFIVLGYWGKNATVDRTILATFSALLGLLTTIFVNWFFIA